MPKEDSGWSVIDAFGCFGEFGHISHHREESEVLRNRAHFQISSGGLCGEAKVIVVLDPQVEDLWYQTV